MSKSRAALNFSAPLFRDAAGIDLSNSSDRLISYILSDPSVGRDNHTIAADAWDLRPFLRNPVFNWAHDTDQPPIGRVVDIGTRGNQLIGTVEYADRDTYPFADTIFRLVKQGYLNAVSTSWIPREWKFSSDRSRPGGVDFSKVELLEVSQVPVPALPTALVTARAQGIDTGPLYEWAERMLDTSSTGIFPRAELETLRRNAKMPANSALRAARLTSFARRDQPLSKFGSLAENIRAIVKAEGGGEVDPRLSRAPTGLNTTDPTAGGFLIEPEYSSELLALAYEETLIAGLCDRRETENPLAEVKVPGIDETSRADGSRFGGVLSYWEAEGHTVPATLPKFKNIAFSGKKLFALIYGTNELMADAPMFEAHVKRVFAAEISFKLDLAALSGTGAGVPQGILNSSATIVVPKVNGQVAATIVSENVQSMWKRLPAPSRYRAVWLANEDVDEQLQAINGGAGGSQPELYQPAGTNGSKYPLLKGRPVLTIEQCPVLGTVGDIVLADLSHYVIVDGGIRPMISAHLQFLTDETVIRFVLHVDGRSAFASPITPYNGSVTRSPFVTLAAR